jgi:hypothetical protein
MLLLKAIDRIIAHLELTYETEGGRENIVDVYCMKRSCIRLPGNMIIKALISKAKAEKSIIEKVLLNQFRILFPDQKLYVPSNLSYPLESRLLAQY